MSEKGSFMEMSTTKDGYIKLKKLSSPVEFETENGKILSITIEGESFKIRTKDKNDTQFHTKTIL